MVSRAVWSPPWLRHSSWALPVMIHTLWNIKHFEGQMTLSPPRLSQIAHPRRTSEFYQPTENTPILYSSNIYRLSIVKKQMNRNNSGDPSFSNFSICISFVHTLKIKFWRMTSMGELYVFMSFFHLCALELKDFNSSLLIVTRCLEVVVSGYYYFWMIIFVVFNHRILRKISTSIYHV